MAFQGYSTGILDGSECGANIDHSVLLVGWGTNSLGKEYYTVKNSWGETWGDSGFGKIAVENGQGACGIHTAAYQPYVNK